ncbi:MAG: hypothetical protein O7H41_11745 [Planctomycetota bacterium]|nr:hypothetical protein [Planctomycetota bacterium]
MRSVCVAGSIACSAGGAITYAFPPPKTAAVPMLQPAQFHVTETVH